MRFLCDTCGIGVASINQWVGHLVGEIHQIKNVDLGGEAVVNAVDSSGRNLEFRVQVPKVLKWVESDRKRSILVTRFADRNISLGMLGAHFLGFGFISDIVADSAKGYAVFQFDSKESVTKVLHHSGNCVVQGKSCAIQALEEVSELEWLLRLELESVCSKEELPNMIQHTLTMSVLRGYDIYQQFVLWLYRTSLIGQGVSIRQAIAKDLESMIHLKFPSVYVYNMTMLCPGLVDVDEVLELYVDPFAHCGAAYTTPLQPDYVTFKYQEAIQHLIYILQNQTVGSMKKMYHEVSTIPDENIPGGNQVITAVNFSQNGIPCRLRFDSAMEANVSSLIAFYITLDSRVLPFLRFIHYWARLHGLTTKYPHFKIVLTMMGLIHLQRKYVLPSVSVLQQLLYSSGNSGISPITGHSWVEGCNVSFSKNITEINTYLKSKGKDMDFLGEGDGFTNGVAGNVGFDIFVPQVLNQKTITSVFGSLMEFFTSFGSNDLSMYIASPFMGNLFYKNTIQQQNLNENISVKKLQELCVGLDLRHPLVVQHPFNLKKNVAEKIDSQFVMVTQGMFRDIANRIRNVVFGDSYNPSMIGVFPDILPHLHRTQASKLRDRDSGCSSLLMSDLAQSDGSIASIADLTTVTKKSKSPSRPGMSYSLVAKKGAVTTAPVPLGKPTSNALGNPAVSYLSPSFRCFKFELSKQFRISFLETCQGLGGMTKLKEKMVILAVIFMRDFSWSTWGRCYYFTNDTFKILESDTMFQQISRMFKEYFAKNPTKINSAADSVWSDTQQMPDLVDGNDSRLDTSQSSDDSECPTEGDNVSPSTGDLGKQNSQKSLAAKLDSEKDEWSFVQRKAGDSSEKFNVTSTSRYRELSERDKKEDLRIKFAKIPKCACKNYCVTMKLKSFQKVWVNRRTKRNAMISRDPHSKFCGNLLLDKETEILINPMDKEEAVTAAVVESVQGHGGKFPASRALWGMDVTVKIDTSGEYPVLYMAMKEGRSPKVCQNMFNYFGNVFPELYAEYMMYRLKKWVVAAGGGCTQANVSH